MMTKELDLIYQELAYNLALKGKISCYPNPAVGCLIVKEGQIISLGYHKFAGTAHAERDAVEKLQQAYPDTWQEKIAHAHVYVTLEPCAHYGRTPPCANLLADCKVAKVTYLSADTTDKVNGKGVKILREAGVEVEFVPWQQCLNLNKDFFALQAQADLPFIKVKIGASLDSKIALPNGNSKWITSLQAREYVQALRWQSDAILTSAKTLIIDQAKYNVRYEQLPQEVKNYLAVKDLKQPKVVIFDNSFLLTGQEEIFKHHQSQNLIIVSQKEHPLANKIPELNFVVGYNSHQKQDLEKILQILKQEYALANVLVETGSSLTNFFLEQKLFSQLHYFMAPKILGSGVQALATQEKFTQLEQCLTLNLLYQINLNEDNLYLVYEQK
ncbi:bifunctional diaminohydroxyphosphoribosylaminopyrimidine deaminase/5-amino-6-(5-phosphoribosylamino)uracil reductase RibD [Psittacicella melopsittaci]|nr:bifunctional diaminohydroxyphosphoribosylaminopyrimidine deaminase/5-amino-6-(5-phosphoribosylamino)uracil reductase RibD [Psittacicella melopsittaci]